MTKVHCNLWGKKVIFYGFLVLYFAILTYLCNKVTLWEDECYALNTTSRNLSEVISQSYNFEAQPPVYFILLKFWRFFNDGFCFARLLSLLFIVLATCFFTRLIRLISGTECLWWLVIIFLLNPFTVWAALEIRSYALIIFLSTISIYFFIKFIYSNKNKHLYSFLIIATIGLYTQYLFVFLVISLMFSFLVFRGWKAFLKLSIYFIPVFLFFLPNLLLISNGIVLQQTDSPDYTLKNTIYLILQTPTILLLGINIIPFEGWLKLVFILISLFIALYAYYILYKKHLVTGDPFFKKVNFILITILVFVCLYIFAFTIFRIVYAHLYMAVAFPLFILLFTMFKVHPSLYRNLFYSSLSLYFIFLLLLTYRHPIKFYDFKSISEYVKTISKYNEPILFYRNGLSLPFEYYYKGNNPFYPLPHAVTFDRNYLINIKDTLEIRHSIEKVNSVSGTYILISDDRAGYLYNVNMNREMVDEYLRINYKTSLDTLYFGRSKTYYLRIRRIGRIQK
jgi:uncharacterized membrane protein